MTSLRTSIVNAVAALILAAGMTANVSAQPCAHRWDVEFGNPGAEYFVWDFEVFDDGTGPALYAAGQFREMQGKRAVGIAKWNGRDWSEVGGGLVGGAHALRVWDDGRGPALYVGGSFSRAGGVQANNIARWDGRQWEALGSGTSGGVYSLGTFDDGRGEALYAGGKFTAAGGSTANLVARWNGAQWEALGEGLLGGSQWGVMSLVTFDDGHGPMLYAGGEFRDARGPKHNMVPAKFLARWDGRLWSAVPGAMLEAVFDFPHVDGLLVHDDGNGEALFVTGQFIREGTNSSLLRWDGREWTAPGGGIGISPGHADALCVYDDGSGPALWIGGGQTRMVKEFRISTMFRWDGRELSVVEPYPISWIRTLASFNDGFGKVLYLGGELGALSGDWRPRFRNIVRWAAPHMVLSHSPLRAGERAVFATTCSTPGQRVNFLYSARGLGSIFIPQLGITIDLDRPHLIGHSIADPSGKSSLSRAIPPGASGRTLWLQAAEVGRKTEVVESIIE